jgi:hypothetical protein
MKNVDATKPLEEVEYAKKQGSVHNETGNKPDNAGEADEIHEDIRESICDKYRT